MQYAMIWSITAAEFFPSSVGLFIVSIMLYCYINLKDTSHLFVLLIIQNINVDFACKNNVFQVFTVFMKQIFTKLFTDFCVCIRRPVGEIKYRVSNFSVTNFNRQKFHCIAINRNIFSYLIVGEKCYLS